MREFELHEPRNLDEALALLAAKGGTARPLAGGTDVLVDVRGGRIQPDALVALQRVDALRGLTRENGTLRLGASTTIADCLKELPLVEHAALRQAAAVFANPMIRNVATLAGNLASASPAGDMLPPLLVLDAQVELVSTHAARTVPLNDFFLGPRQTVRRADELIAAVRVPTAAAHTGEAFYKLGLRQADAISIVSVAVWLSREGERIRDLRIALGAVAPRPLRALRAEELLRGQLYGESLARQAGELAAQECSPIDDLRGSAAYRRRMVAVYVRRMLAQAWARAE